MIYFVMFFFTCLFFLYSLHAEPLLVNITFWFTWLIGITFSDKAININHQKINRYNINNNLQGIARPIWHDDFLTFLVFLHFVCVSVFNLAAYTVVCLFVFVLCILVKSHMLHLCHTHTPTRKYIHPCTCICIANK